MEEMNLPLVPLHRLQPVAVEAQHRVATRTLGIAKQEVAHVHAVDHLVNRDLHTRGEQQRGERVDLVHELITDLPGRHMTGPTDHARRPVGALERGEQPVPHTSRRIWVDRGHAIRGVRTVIRDPHDDGVVGKPWLVELVQDDAGEGVHLGQDVSPVAALRLTPYSGSGRGGMCTCVYGRFT